METLQDKILGSWFGMVLGDAMGMAVKGLKPETVKQCFGEMDDFQDVRSFVGREVKHYRMKGLYGVETQIALAVCDSILKDQKVVAENISDLLLQLTAGGPEHYFGVYRGEEGSFRHTAESFVAGQALVPSEKKYSGAGYLPMAVPIALFRQKHSPEMVRQCMETCALLTRHPLEVLGAGLTGFLITAFLSLETEPEGEGLEKKELQLFFRNAVDACETAESGLKERFPEIWQEFGENVCQALRLTIQELQERLGSDEQAQLFNWICTNASRYSKNAISHPTQGQVLTLLPLALYLVLKGGNDFQSIMTRALNMGKEATKLGALVGALAGGLYGFEAIPKHWKSGLVNAREIRARGEALFQHRYNKNLKDIYDMELSLTTKESEERKRYAPKMSQKTGKKAKSALELMEDELEESPIPSKEDSARWRKFERDKSRMKRDRRRNLKSDFGF